MDDILTQTVDDLGASPVARAGLLAELGPGSLGFLQTAQKI